MTLLPRQKKGCFPWKCNRMVHEVLAMLLKDKTADNPFLDIFVLLSLKSSHIITQQ